MTRPERFQSVSPCLTKRQIGMGVLLQWRIRYCDKPAHGLSGVQAGGLAARPLNILV